MPRWRAATLVMYGVRAGPTASRTVSASTASSPSSNALQWSQAYSPWARCQLWPCMARVGLAHRGGGDPPDVEPLGVKARVVVRQRLLDGHVARLAGAPIEGHRPPLGARPLGIVRRRQHGRFQPDRPPRLAVARLDE